MKANLRGISLAGLLALAGTLAQGAATIRANVPFDFIVGNQTLSSGHYTVRNAGVPAAVVLSCSDCKGTAIAVGPSLYSPMSRNRARLVFHRYGDKYFLVEVWGDGNAGRQIPRTAQERELANRVAPTETFIAALW